MTKTKEHAPVYQAMFNMLASPDPRSYGVYKMLDTVYPAFAKKIMDGNRHLYDLLMSGYNPMDILDYFVCDRCECLSAQSGRVRRGKNWYVQSTCLNPKCGHTTTNPHTLRDWMRDELKKKATPETIDYIDIVVDQIAESMVRKASLELASQTLLADRLRNPRIGQDGEVESIIQPDAKPRIEVNMGPVEGLTHEQMIQNEQEELDNA